MVLLLTGFGRTLQTAHNLPWSIEKKNTTSRTQIMSCEAVKARQSTTIPSQSGNSEAASSDNWPESKILTIHSDFYLSFV